VDKGTYVAAISLEIGPYQEGGVAKGEKEFTATPLPAREAGVGRGQARNSSSPSSGAVAYPLVSYPIVEDERMSPSIEPFNPQNPISLALNPPSTFGHIIAYDAIVRSAGGKGDCVDVGKIELDVSSRESGLLNVKYQVMHEYATLNGRYHCVPAEFLNNTEETIIDNTGRETNPEMYKNLSLDFMKTEGYLGRPAVDFIREYHFRLPCFPKGKDGVIEKGDKWQSYDDFSVDIFKDIVFEVEGFARVDGIETAVLKESVPDEIAEEIGIDLEGRIYVCIEDKLPLFGSETVTYNYTDGTTFTVQLTFRRE
jgi:hypothetical protein